MAGPGGGPPRRSHTKSRKGCDSCKRRHIRCDEAFPQCRNCTKHKSRCPYNDSPLLNDRSSGLGQPDLMWTPDNQHAITQWITTGHFPFPTLNIFPAPRPGSYTLVELRLIHHVASICHKLAAIDANEFTLWTSQIPTIIKIGSTNGYVMHALLAFSAMHIAYLTDCPIVGNLAFVHRGLAFNGLQEAISLFSQDTSDAVLAASLCLSWQATDWRSWRQLMAGTSTVMDEMEAWKHMSKFGDFIAESGTFPSAPRSPLQHHKPSQPRKEDLEAFGEAQQHVQKVETYLKHYKQDTKLVQQLLVFMKGARKLGPSRSVEEQFDRLGDLRTWLFWLPVSCLEHSGVSTGALLTLAHYYTVALMVEKLFPEIGAAYFGSLSVKPIEEIYHRLMTVSQAGQANLSVPLSLMDFPIDTVGEFRSRMGWVQPTRQTSYPPFSAPDLYVNDTVHLARGGAVSPAPYQSMAYSYSADVLPLIKRESASPTVSSPYLSQPYLNVPSPSFGAYSPASSTFEGSLAYGDKDDYGKIDVSCLSSSRTLLGDGYGEENYSICMPPTITTEQLSLDNIAMFSLYQTTSPYVPSTETGLLALPESNMSLLSSHNRHLSTASAPASLSFVKRAPELML